MSRKFSLSLKTLCGNELEANLYHTILVEKQISGVHAKSLTYRSNARKRKIVIASPKKRSISENSKIQTCFLDQNQGENHTGFSRKDLVLSENRKGKSQADASFARRKAMILKIALTKKIKPSDFLSIYKPPLIILLTKLKLR